VTKAVASKKTGIWFSRSAVAEEDLHARRRCLLDARDDPRNSAIPGRAFCVDGLKQIVRLHHRVINTLLLSW
jgi:hypothetical protein